VQTFFLAILFSSLLLFIFLFLLSVFPGVRAVIDPYDAAALTTFYDSLTDPGLLQWDTTNLCAQKGVYCDTQTPYQRVFKL